MSFPADFWQRTLEACENGRDVRHSFIIERSVNGSPANIPLACGSLLLLCFSLKAVSRTSQSSMPRLIGLL
jgi:hypothetical protein